MTEKRHGGDTRTHICVYTCECTHTRGCPDLFSSKTAAAQCCRSLRKWRKQPREDKAPGPAGSHPLTSSCSKCAGMGQLCLCSSASVRGSAGPRRWRREEAACCRPLARRAVRLGEAGAEVFKGGCSLGGWRGWILLTPASR